MLKADGCSVSALSLIDNNYSFLGNYPDIKINLELPLLTDLKKLIDSKNISTLLKLSKEVNFILDENRFALIPNAFFEETEVPKIFKLSNYMMEEELLISKNIDSIDHYVVYPINPFIKEFIDKLKFNTSINSRVGHFLSLTKLNSGMDSNFRVHFCSESMEIAYFNNGELKFYNNFNADCLEDKIYFIVYTIELLKLSQQETTLVCSGSIEKDDKLHKALEEYIKTIQFARRNNSYSYFFKLNIVEDHQFINLFA